MSAFFLQHSAHHPFLSLSNVLKPYVQNPYLQIGHTLPCYAVRYQTVSAMIRGGRGAELLAAHEELCQVLKKRDVSHIEEIVRESYFGEVLQNS